jgi:hypothetical protein
MAENDQVRAAWWQEKQDKVMNMESVQGSGSQLESAREYGWFTP